MEYKVPFSCADKNMKNRRIALGYYIQNLLSADKFDIESAMPVIRDFIKKDKDILETNVPALVAFLGRVGSKELRKPTDLVKEPTKWFCERLARLLKAIKPTDYFLERLGYAYVKADISHKWIQALFNYKGSYRKALFESMTYALMDVCNGDPYKNQEGIKKTFEVLYDIYEKITDPERLPAPLYLLLLSCRRTYKVTDWYRFTKTNINFGRDENENRQCLRFLITSMMKRLDDETCAYKEKQSIIEGLRMIGKSRESKYFAECVFKRMKGIASRSEYLFYRQLVSDEDFAEYGKTISKKVDSKLCWFAKAYEHPENEFIFGKLTWKEKVMLFDRFGKTRMNEIKQKCVSEFDKYLNASYYKKELFYVFKIVARDKKKLESYLHDRRLFNKSLESSKFRILYLEKMHAVDNKYLQGNKTVYIENLHGDSTNTAIAFLPSVTKRQKIKKYRSVLMTIKEGESLLCEVITRKPSSRYSVYSAVKFTENAVPKTVYPNIDKRMALFFAQKILSSGRKDAFSAAIETKSVLKLKLI